MTELQKKANDAYRYVFETNDLNLTLKLMIAKREVMLNLMDSLKDMSDYFLNENKEYTIVIKEIKMAIKKNINCPDFQNILSTKFKF